MKELIEAIKNMQAMWNISDQKLARKIGIDPGHVSRIKRGLAPPGAKFLRQLASTYPELRPAISDYISGREEAAA